MIGYFETLAIVEASGVEGLEYSKVSRGMKAHIRSLIAEGIVASYVGDGSGSLDTEGAMVCTTQVGANYVEMLTDLGLLAVPVKAKAKTTRKPKAVQSVPTPVESVISLPAVAPEGKKIHRVAGNKADQAVVVSITQEDRMKVVEAQLSALMDIIESNLILA